MTLSESLKREIRSLLRRSASPRVKVAASRLPAGGRGVFTVEPVVPKGAALCLYPGIYTPGLPLWEMGDTVYLGGTSLPSGVYPVEHNAYILNLQTAGGYLDGLAIEDLAENPQTCAHLVNHSKKDANVHVVSFVWHQVMGDDGDKSDTYALPNRRRSDGTPWFLRNYDEMVRFEPNEHPCGGAIFCASRDLTENEELYFDYKLQPPLPAWARDWYDCE
jgi:hypothetical protein